MGEERYVHMCVCGWPTVKDRVSLLPSETFSSQRNWTELPWEDTHLWNLVYNPRRTQLLQRRLASPTKPRAVLRLPEEEPELESTEPLQHWEPCCSKRPHILVQPHQLTEQTKSLWSIPEQVAPVEEDLMAGKETKNFNKNIMTILG